MVGMGPLTLLVNYSVYYSNYDFYLPIDKIQALKLLVAVLDLSHRDYPNLILCAGHVPNISGPENPCLISTCT